MCNVLPFGVVNRVYPICIFWPMNIMGFQPLAKQQHNKTTVISYCETLVTDVYQTSCKFSRQWPKALEKFSKWSTSAYCSWQEILVTLEKWVASKTGQGPSLLQYLRIPCFVPSTYTRTTLWHATYSAEFDRSQC
jgi:hypothetical protein